MAVIEREYSERGLNVPQQAPMDIKAATTGGRLFEEIGQTSSELAQRFEKAQTLAEQTKAQNVAEKGFQDIETRFSMTDISQLKPEEVANLQKQHLEEIGKVLQESSKHISTETGKNAFLLEQDRNAEISRQKIRSMTLKKSAENWKVEYDTFDKIQEQNYVHATTPAERETAILERKTKIRDKVNAHVITAAEGANEDIISQQRWDKSFLAHQAASQPEKFKQDVAAGFYKGMPQEDIDKSLKSADSEIKKKEVKYLKEAKTQMKIRADQFQTDLNLGKLDPAAVKEQMLIHEADPAKGITPKLAKALLKGHESSLSLDAKTDSDLYKKLVRDMVDPASDPEQVRVDIINANAEGKLSKGDMNELYQLNLIPTKEGQFTSVFKVFGEDIAERDIENARKSLLSKTISMLMPVVPSLAFHLVKDFITHIGKKGVSDKDIPKIANEFKKQYRLKARPEIASYPETGCKHMDELGNVATVYPDGRVEEESEDSDTSDASY
jgi:hypothetical protein